MILIFHKKINLKNHVDTINLLIFATIDLEDILEKNTKNLFLKPCNTDNFL